jgi:hypothetical protein
MKNESNENGNIDLFFVKSLGYKKDVGAPNKNQLIKTKNEIQHSRVQKP